MINKKEAMDAIYAKMKEYEEKPALVLGMGVAMSIIKDLPETGKGEWIHEEMYDGDEAYRCSECRELFCLEYGKPEYYLYNFCPNCGAKMEDKG